MIRMASELNAAYSFRLWIKRDVGSVALAQDTLQFLNEMVGCACVLAVIYVNVDVKVVGGV
jgi:hypothetical protein